MKYKQKYKLFKKDYYFINFDTKNIFQSMTNQYIETAWMKGFESCEKIYEQKLQKFLDEKGI